MAMEEGVAVEGRRLEHLLQQRLAIDANLAEEILEHLWGKGGAVSCGRGMAVERRAVGTRAVERAVVRAVERGRTSSTASWKDPCICASMPLEAAVES